VHITEEYSRIKVGERTDELRGGRGGREEVVEEDQGAEAEAYPPREVRLVEPGDPCVGAAPRVRQRETRKSGGYERSIPVPGRGGGGGTEGEAEDGEVDLLRRVGAGGADANGKGTAVMRGSGCGLREGEDGEGERLEVEQRWCAGEEQSHGGLVVSVRACVPSQFAGRSDCSLFRCRLRQRGRQFLYSTQGGADATPHTQWVWAGLFSCIGEKE
jgi:hypothetical protein